MESLTQPSLPSTELPKFTTAPSDPGEETASPREAATRAIVRVAVPLTPEESQRLHSLLERLFHRPLELAVEVTPSVIGGVWVRVGDEVIDGSVRGQLETLRYHLRTQSRIMITSHLTFTQPKGTI
ncbi:MAG: F0F1 ATP synthase subunit delta [Chloroflexi bacterium]|jgi:hypothetical protein|nr:F0F1 ATP synthase subunit delta [Chloroflexota bacterium]